MTVANLKNGQRNFVVMPERGFDDIQRESVHYRRLLKEDRPLGEIASKELKAFRELRTGEMFITGCKSHSPS